VITTEEDLAAFLKEIAPHDRLAVDTEADSLHCYFEKLCLIQVTIPGSDVLIDPLAGFSIVPLCEEFARHEIIIHGADYDLRLLDRTGGFKPIRIFDTMLAARLTGRTEFSLAALLSANFNVTLAKASQKANWARRPLPQQMLEYAVNDTHYLLGLAEMLEGELRNLGRWEWFTQSCVRAIASAASTRVRDADTVWRISGSSDLEGRSSAILRALWTWRDEEARAVDRPAFHILHNELLITCARSFDAGQPFVPRHLAGSRRERFMEAAERALNLPQAEWPVRIRKPRLRPTSEQQRLFSQLKTTRDRVASELKLDPAIIASKAALEAVSTDPESAPERLMTWQRQLLEIEAA
jgi:ribonuclease D